MRTGAQRRLRLDGRIAASVRLHFDRKTKLIYNDVGMTLGQTVGFANTGDLYETFNEGALQCHGAL